MRAAPWTALVKGASALAAGAVLAVSAGACGDCGPAAGRPDGGVPRAVTDPGCGVPAYGDARLAALYAVRANGQSAMLTADVDALRSVASTLVPLLDRARAIPADPVPRAAREVVVADAWGAAARLQRDPAASATGQHLGEALAALVRHLAVSDRARPGDDRPPTPATALLPRDDGWREFDTEHSVLAHERVFGLRRAFRIFVRGDHSARALVSQLLAIDGEGEAYLTDVPGEVELLELDATGPTRARVWRLDRERLGCGEVRLVEETEVLRIPGPGADGFLLDLGAPESLSTMPCARCHEDADAFSLPTTRTAVRDRLTALLRSATANAREALGVVTDRPGSP